MSIFDLPAIQTEPVPASPSTFKSDQEGRLEQLMARTAAVSEDLARLRQETEQVRVISLENFDDLDRRMNGRKAPTVVRPGPGLAVDDRFDRLWNLAASKFKSGLLVANGSDRGKINVSYDFLGVGPYIIGDGTTRTITIDMGLVGIDGLRRGLTEAADTWYHGYICVGDSEVGEDAELRQATPLHPPGRTMGVRVCGIFDTSDPPVVPPGYSWTRRIGSFRNNGGQDFYRVVHSQDNARFVWNEVIGGATDFRVLNAIGSGAASFTDVDCSAVVPPSSRCALMRINYNQATVEGVHLRGNDMSNIAIDIGSLATGASVAGNGGISSRVDSNQILEYAVTNVNDDAEIYVIGYFDSL